MHKPAPPARWYTPWRAAAAPQYDPADLGTAFGLDMSMASEDFAPAAAPVTPPATSAHRMGWIPRWSLRRHNAA